MRLAQPLYESMPLVYAGIGASAFAVAYLEPEGPRGVIVFCIALLAEVAALTVVLRRQDYRARSREYSGEAVDLPSRLNI